MDPNSGAILGMVSLGNFDLNDYQKVSDKDQEAIDAETDPDKKAEMLSAAQTKQWRNKALSDTYEPWLDVQDHHAGHGARRGRGQ